MPSSLPTPPDDDFPAGQTGDMRDVLLSPPTGPKTPAGPWQPPSAEELQKLLPQYEITALLGRGGMGAVYKGRQIALDRPVAIKILSNTLDEADASFAERFKNEARALGKLSHPGIVGVYDFGEAANGLLYIVMEFIDGTDVARMLAQQKRLHTEHAMAITAHVCDALAYAHERGIIHRDIKPANIMVGYDGVVKVADFGLAKMTHSQNSGLTQSGMAMGTLHYMAPEALMLGAGVDHRADIYAVGVMLYQMLTGKIPQGLFELPSLQVPGLDPRYDSIIGRALREDREVRYPSVLAMRHDLDAILTQPVVKVEAAAEKAPAALNTMARPQRPGGQPYLPPRPQVVVRTEKKSSPLIWVVLLVLGGLAGWLYLDRSNRTQPTGTPAQGTPATVADTSSAPGPATTPKTPSAQTLPTTARTTPSLPVPATPVAGTPKMTVVSSDPPNTTTRVIDLLPLVDVKRDAMSGSWDFKGQDLILAAGNGNSPRIQFPHAIQIENYDFEIEFSSLDRRPIHVGQRFPAAGRQLYWAMNLFKDNPTPYFGFPALDGVTAASSTEACVFKSGQLPPGTRHRAIVKVRQQSLTGMLDGETLVHWEGNLGRFQETGGPKPRDIRYPVINADDTGVIIHKATIIEFLSPQLPPPTTLPTGPTTWTDTKGRTITATFKAIASGNVLLDIAGNVTPVPLNTLSAESQKLARDYQQRTSPATATKDAPFVNSLGMRFVPVPITGGPTDGKRVLFSVWETRVQDYEVFAKETKRRRPELRFVQGPTHPAVNVSWNDAQAFCIWLTQRERMAGRISAQESYRLPTDHEWSCAVGLGTLEDSARLPVEKHEQNRKLFPWGDAWPIPPGAGNYSGEECEKQKIHGSNQPIHQGYRDDFTGTSPVGSFRANVHGLFDMGGNAWECCDDWFSAQQREKVSRGSAFTAPGVPSSNRLATLPSLADDSRGFRCVLEVSAPHALPPLPATGSSPSKTSAPSSSSFVTLSLDEIANRSIENFKSQAVGRVVLNGVPFDFSAAPKFFVSQIRWIRDAPTSATVKVNVANPAFLYVLVCGAGGEASELQGKEIGAIRLGFADGSEHVARLRMGTHLRREVWASNDTNPTTPPGDDTIQVTNGIVEPQPFQRGRPATAFMDMLTIALPAAKALTSLTSITFADTSSETANDAAPGFEVHAATVHKAAASSAAASSSSSQSSASKDAPFTNTLGMKFVPVPGTRTLFCIHETRRQDYMAYAAEVTNVDDSWKDVRRDGIPCGDKDDHPVVGVSWEDAQKFCAWLSKKEGKNYRLPTDAEWSTAVGLKPEQRPQGTTPETLSGRETSEFPWNGDFPPATNAKAGNYGDTAWKGKFPSKDFIQGYTDGFPTTAAVMSFPANRLGLHDMGGNAWEWVEDWWNAAQKERTMRGASFSNCDQESLLSSYRNHPAPWIRLTDIGFRCVIELP